MKTRNEVNETFESVRHIYAAIYSASNLVAWLIQNVYI
jgi:hypothetical protein